VTATAHLSWTGPPPLPDALREQLFGAGAPFERRREPVAGRDVEVFVQRPANAAAALARGVAGFGDRVFLAFPDEQLSFAEVDAITARMAAVLVHAHGVQPGDRVAIMAANTMEHALAIWAVLRAGGVSTGFNGWWTATEARHAVDLVTPVVALADAGRAERLAGLDVPVVDLVSLRDRAGGAEALVDPAIGEDEPASILFTSGTTGRAKAATLSHRALLHFSQVNVMRGALGALAAAAAGAPALSGPPPQPTALTVNPLFHVSGSVVMLGAPFSGLRVVFPSPGRWDPTTHLEMTARYRVQSWSGVPTQLGRLIDHPHLRDHDLSSLRQVTSGGASLSPTLIRRYGERLPHVALGTGYGASETAGLGTGITGAEYLAHPTSVGAAAPTSEVEVRRSDGSVAGVGERGEVFVRNASVMLGYWGDAEATAAAVDADGWYRTGDVGYVADGRLHLDGRGRDRIIRGGENIAPLEIENRIVDHPDVDVAAVIGVDDEALGQEVVAVVVRREGATVDAEALRAWVAQELAPFKVPRDVVFVAQLPLTATGKVIKTELERTWPTFSP
jgi:acyl-CoA synthetase (AMP-forming)/AMP-acid ligase II